MTRKVEKDQKQENCKCKQPLSIKHFDAGSCCCHGVAVTEIVKKSDYVDAGFEQQPFLQLCSAAFFFHQRLVGIPSLIQDHPFLKLDTYA